MSGRAELWIPGPVEVRPEILAECSRPMIGHRSSAMRDLLAALVPGLQSLFGTRGSVILSACSASGLMEAAIRNFVPRRVLCLVNGAFAARFHAIALACGKEAVKVEIPWGEGVTVALVEQGLRSGPFDAVAFVVNETSTGAFSSIAEVASAVRAKAPDALLLADCVTALAGAPVEFDKNGLDFAFAGSQKALALPPGLALAAVSSRALERARAVRDRGWYFDVPLLAEQLFRFETPATPAIPLLFALKKQFEDVERAGGWEARYARHREMAEIANAWGESRGLPPFPSPAFRSPTVSCLRADGLDVAAFRERLGERGFLVGDGYGPLKGKTFRIGHMGDHTAERLRRLLAAAEESLAQVRSHS